MKSSLPFLLLMPLILLAACAAGPNSSAGTPGTHGDVAGFWLGVWQGFIAAFVFVASLFKRNLNIWYNLGYLFGVACFFGGTKNRTSRRKQISANS
jgi:undecaprenyl pyrophosphate phosphatase UppP